MGRLVGTAIERHRSQHRLLDDGPPAVKTHAYVAGLRSQDPARSLLVAHELWAGGWRYPDTHWDQDSMVVAAGCTARKTNMNPASSVRLAQASWLVGRIYFDIHWDQDSGVISVGCTAERASKDLARSLLVVQA
jgi:hypothetical protein